MLFRPGKCIVVNGKIVKLEQTPRELKLDGESKITMIAGAAASRGMPRDAVPVPSSPRSMYVHVAVVLMIMICCLWADIALLAVVSLL